MSKEVVNWTKKQYILEALCMSSTATMEEIYNIDFHSFINKNNPNRRLNSILDGIMDARTVNAILRAKLNTIRDVMAKNKHDLKQISGMGEKSVQKLINFLEIMLTKNPHKEECTTIRIGVIDEEGVKHITLKDIKSYEIADGFLKIHTHNTLQCISLDYIHGYIVKTGDVEE